MAGSTTALETAIIEFKERTRERLYNMTTELEEGDFVESIDSKGTTHSHLRVDKYGLDAMAERAHERPGQPLLAGRSIPFKYTNALRVRRRDPYLTQDGQIKVSVRSTGDHTEDGDRLVDVYFTWQPFPDITTH